MTERVERDSTTGADGIEEMRMPTRTRSNAAAREAVRRRVVARRTPRPLSSTPPAGEADGAIVVSTAPEAGTAEATATEATSTKATATEATATEATATKPAAPAERATAGRRTRRTGGTGRRPRPLVVCLVVVLVAAIAAAVAAGYGWYAQHRLDEAHQQALAAARQTTVNFVSVSAATVDRDLKRVTDGATGDFKDEFSRGAAQVRAAVVENKVDSRGSVLRAALVSGNTDSAVVLVAVDATVKNAKAPQGRLSHYRIQVNMTKDGKSGRWLVSKLQFVG